jgi:hypothetical protein
MSGLVVLILIVVGFFIYFLPCVVASSRGSASGGSVFLVNLLFGWTLIGWLIALVMAVSTETSDAVELRKLQLKQARRD